MVRGGAGPDSAAGPASTSKAMKPGLAVGRTAEAVASTIRLLSPALWRFVSASRAPSSTSGRVVADAGGFGSPSCRTAARSRSAASLSAPLCRARRLSPTTGAATRALPSAATNTSPSLNGAIRRSPRSICLHPSGLRKPENVAERHPSRGQSRAPASLPQRIHLPLQPAVLSVQRLPFPARHRGRRHRTDLLRALLRSLAAPYMLGVWVTIG